MDSITDNTHNILTAETLELLKKKLATLKARGTILSVEDLAQRLFHEPLEEVAKDMSIRDDPRGKEVMKATQMLKIYLILSDGQCARAVKFRSQGWHDNREAGDAHFRQQRERADSTTPDEERNFYKMMVQIGEEMNQSNHIFLIPFVPSNQTNILDLCMAPGGYTAAALEYCNSFKAYGITLSTESGGHTVIIGKNHLQGLRLCDITMFTEFCPTDKHIPEGLKSKFSDIQPFKSIKFHLVFADGKTLRTHDRIKNTYDADLNKETVRLQTSQLILAMNRIHNGGTLVMLLHKVDTWHSAFLLYTFSKFAKVEVFKPIRKHATRSSFYMIAKEININHPEAFKAISGWKEDWYCATFGGPDQTGLPKEEPTDESVQELLTEFGPRLIELGHEAWKIQADALSRTNYAGSTTDGKLERISSKRDDIKEKFEIEMKVEEIPIYSRGSLGKVSISLRKRIWGGLKGVFKDHHDGLKMERGMGYAPLGGRGSGGWATASGGEITIGSRGEGVSRPLPAPGQEGNGGGAGGDRGDNRGDNRAMFMMGA
ncbi:hypothetical protein NHQ30_006485 [Ciborinia camelliae]|nr:hypothetical protein NHQ30_006485 [Ciborinia camelliae]